MLIDQKGFSIAIKNAKMYMSFAYILNWQLGMLIDQDSKNLFLKIHDVYVLLDNFIPL